MNGTKMMAAVLVAGLAGRLVGAAAACCPWAPKDQKSSAPGSSTEATVTAGGVVDAAYAAEPSSARPGRAAKKKIKAAEAKYECPSCKMAFDKPGDCPSCKTSLVPKKAAPKKS